MFITLAIVMRFSLRAKPGLCFRLFRHYGIFGCSTLSDHWKELAALSSCQCGTPVLKVDPCPQFHFPPREVDNVPPGGRSSARFAASLIKLLCSQASGSNVLFQFPIVFLGLAGKGFSFACANPN